MTHVAKILEHKPVVDTGLAILVRCCDDPQTDSWHTQMDITTLCDADLDTWCDQKVSEAQDKHDKVTHAKEKLAARISRSSSNA